MFVHAVIAEQVLPRPGFATELSEQSKFLSLLSRLEGDISTLSGLGPALPFFGDTQLYWPSWMFGTFDISSTLRAIDFSPDGSAQLPHSDLVPDRLLDIATLPLSPGAAAGAESRWQGRWFSTLADTLDNNLRVNLGLGVPSARIVEDRAANARAEVLAAGRARVCRSDD